MKFALATAGVPHPKAKAKAKGGNAKANAREKAKHPNLGDFQKADWESYREKGYCMNYQRGTCNKSSSECPHKHQWFPHSSGSAGRAGSGSPRPRKEPTQEERVEMGKKYCPILAKGLPCRFGADKCWYSHSDDLKPAFVSASLPQPASADASQQTFRYGRVVALRP